MGDIIAFPRTHEARMIALKRKTLEEVRTLWDRYDGINMPDGFDGTEIHFELNRRGDGFYCAV